MTSQRVNILETEDNGSEVEEIDRKDSRLRWEDKG